mmetsp:Transcript_10223/g.20975  ORF Transcript_10223/g.20975 Transcript_10223/m.20975 type:complete len:111 (+) Transcript_10223:611-943(+)
MRENREEPDVLRVGWVEEDMEDIMLSTDSFNKLKLPIPITAAVIITPNGSYLVAPAGYIATDDVFDLRSAQYSIICDRMSRAESTSAARTDRDPDTMNAKSLVARIKTFM